MAFGGWLKRVFGGQARGHPARLALDDISRALAEARSFGHDEGAEAPLRQILEVDVPAFLDRREQMVAEVGLEPYAEMIGHFAGVERNVDRALAALLMNRGDEEIPAALAEADGDLSRAIAALDRALSRGGPAEDDAENIAAGEG